MRWAVPQQDFDDQTCFIHRGCDAAAAFCTASTISAEVPDKEHAELAKALAGVKLTLEAGLDATAASGKPISAKYEVEDGKLQLSVYTEKDGKFGEVIVDHHTGKVGKNEPITQGEDLAAPRRYRKVAPFSYPSALEK